MQKNTVTVDLMLPDFKDVVEEQKREALSNFFIQIQGVLMGASFCLPPNCDFKLRINNQEIVNKISLPEVLLEKIRNNNNIISVINVVSGDGTIFK
jgi:hypothetical protein